MKCKLPTPEEARAKFVENLKLMDVMSQQRDICRHGGMWNDVVEFNQKFGLRGNESPGFNAPEIMKLRLNFLLEELLETAEACGYELLWDVGDKHVFELRDPLADRSQRELELAFDGLIDLVYVALGNAHLMGLDFPEGWRRVHLANMRKVRAEKPGDSKRGSSFDVVKPLGWVPAYLGDLMGSCEGSKFAEGEGHD